MKYFYDHHDWKLEFPLLWDDEAATEKRLAYIDRHMRFKGEDAVKDERIKKMQNIGQGSMDAFDLGKGKSKD